MRCKHTLANAQVLVLDGPMNSHTVCRQKPLAHLGIWVDGRWVHKRNLTNTRSATPAKPIRLHLRRSKHLRPRLWKQTDEPIHDGCVVLSAPTVDCFLHSLLVGCLIGLDQENHGHPPQCLLNREARVIVEDERCDSLEKLGLVTRGWNVETCGQTKRPICVPRHVEHRPWSDADVIVPVNSIVLTILFQTLPKFLGVTVPHLALKTASHCLVHVQNLCIAKSA